MKVVMILTLQRPVVIVKLTNMHLVTNECTTLPSAHSASAATRGSRPAPAVSPARSPIWRGPAAQRCPAGRRRRYQSLVSLAKGVMIRS